MSHRESQILFWKIATEVGCFELYNALKQCVGTICHNVYRITSTSNYVMLRVQNFHFIYFFQTKNKIMFISF